MIEDNKQFKDVRVIFFFYNHVTYYVYFKNLLLSLWLNRYPSIFFLNNL